MARSRNLLKYLLSKYYQYIPIKIPLSIININSIRSTGSLQGLHSTNPPIFCPISMIHEDGPLPSILIYKRTLQKGGVPAAPSGTATLLRLSPNYQFCPRPILAVTDFRHPRLSWLDGRCVQGPGTYSPRHG